MIIRVTNDIDEMIAFIPIVGLFFFVIVLAATAVVGGVLQVVFGKRWGTRSAKIGA